MNLTKESKIYIDILREVSKRAGGDLSDEIIVKNALYIAVQCARLSNDEQQKIVAMLEGIKDH